MSLWHIRISTLAYGDYHNWNTRKPRTIEKYLLIDGSFLKGS